tara:strand:- start:1414 stop:1617 length:204 start_codon:yes stop_codon:yes gene_type:complete
MTIKTMNLFRASDNQKLATEYNLFDAMEKARQLAVQHRKIYIRDCLGGLRAEINLDAPQQHQTKRTP